MRHQLLFAAALSLSVVAPAYAGRGARLDALLQSDDALRSAQHRGWTAKTRALGRIASDRELSAVLKERNRHIVLASRSGEGYESEPIHEFKLGFLRTMELSAPAKVRWEQLLVRSAHGVYLQTVKSRAPVSRETADALIADVKAQLATNPTFAYAPSLPPVHAEFGPRYTTGMAKVKLGLFSKGLKLDDGIWDAHLTEQGIAQAVDEAIAAWAPQ